MIDIHFIIKYFYNQRSNDVYKTHGGHKAATTGRKVLKSLHVKHPLSLSNDKDPKFTSIPTSYAHVLINIGDFKISSSRVRRWPETVGKPRDLKRRNLC